MRSVARKPAVTNDECKGKPAMSLSTRRPDACVSRVCNQDWDATLAFGEVKCADQAQSNKFGIARDLIPVGRTITVYAVSLLSDGLYAMQEVSRLVVPASLRGVGQYLGQAADVLKIIAALDQCQPMNDANASAAASRKPQDAEHTRGNSRP
ncbi:hypothetical protein BC940DRAFT_329564 [Gongronella butleri]|nr:hypothetical protein BC940DRAFT_329564 [Gongronella butleri]